MNESMSEIFERIMNGTVSRKEVDAAHARVCQTSVEVHESFKRLDAQQAKWGALPKVSGGSMQAFDAELEKRTVAGIYAGGSLD